MTHLTPVYSIARTLTLASGDASTLVHLDLSQGRHAFSGLHAWTGNEASATTFTDVDVADYIASKVSADEGRPNRVVVIGFKR